MATSTIENTYELAPETVRRIEAIAASWGISESEVVRRAVDSVVAGRRAPLPQAAGKPPALAAFEALQESLQVSEEEAERWAGEVLAGRRAWGQRRIKSHG